MAGNPHLLQLSKSITFDADAVKAENLCARFGHDDLARLGNWVYDGYYADRLSRSKWERRSKAAMELALQIQKGKTFPWMGASNVAFPLITIAALQFSANSYSNIIQGTDVVHYRVVGENKSGIVTERARRIARHMSWQVLEQDQAWEEEHDRLLINLAVVGTNFVKTYFDASAGYPVGELVTAQDLVVNYWARSLETAARKTQRFVLSRNEIYERIAQGTFRDVRQEAWYNSTPIPPATDGDEDNRRGQSPPQDDPDAPYSFLEQHRFLDLDHDGYAEPYIVTLEEKSKCVCRIVARVASDRDVHREAKKILYIKPEEYFTKYSFIANPDRGFYDLGFGTLLGPLNESVSTIINQMIDNGSLQNSIGGFLGRGMKIRGGGYTMAPFEFKRVDSTGDDIKKNMVMFEPREVPQVLFQLLGLLIEYSNRIAGTTDVMVGENPGQNTPASTFQGLQERGLNIYAWIFKRVWRSMKQEFKQRYILNSQFTGAWKSFGPDNSVVYSEDYKGNPDQIAPVADPNMPSTTMRLQQAMFVAQRAQVVPGYAHDEVERAVLRAVRAPNPSRLYPGVGKAQPLPNPKLEIEQLKLKGMQLKLSNDQKKWANELMEERRLNDAKIANLQAQSAKLVAEAGGVKSANQLKAFELALGALQQYSQMLSQRIEGLTNAANNQSPTNGSAQSGGVGGVEGSEDDSALDGGAGAGAGAAEGALGGGGNGAGPGGAVVRNQ